MALGRDKLNLLLVALSAFLLVGNLDRLPALSFDALRFALLDVDFWTYFWLFSAAVLLLLVVAKKYRRNGKAIRRLNLVKYMTPEEFEAHKRETTKRALSELARNPKYLQLKARLEREQANGTKVDSPPLTEDDDEDDLSLSDD